PQMMEMDVPSGMIAAFAVAAAALLMRRADRSTSADLLGRAKAAAMSGAVLHAIAFLAMLWFGGATLPAPQTHAYAAGSWALIAYAALHAFIAFMSAAFVFARIGAGYVSATRSQEVSIARLFSDYSCTVYFILLMFLIFPELKL